MDVLPHNTANLNDRVKPNLIIITICTEELHSSGTVLKTCEGLVITDVC